MYRFELTGAPRAWSGPLILRLVPFSGTQVLIEAALQEGARGAGLPAPAVLMAEPSADPLDVPFMVMETLPGHGVVRGIQWHRFARSFPALVVSWPETFAKVVALLGGADVGPALAALERYGVPVEDALTTRHLSLSEEELGHVPAFADLLGWLKLHEPTLPTRLSLVHGDLWPANVLVKRRTVTGIVDWTMGGLGDRALDVGFARVGMAKMPEPFPPPAPISNLVHAAGLSVAKRMLEKTAPVLDGTDRISYFEVLRCTIELAAVHMGRRLGRRVAWERGIPGLLAHIGKITGIDVRFQ